MWDWIWSKDWRNWKDFTSTPRDKYPPWETDSGNNLRKPTGLYIDAYEQVLDFKTCQILKTPKGFYISVLGQMPHYMGPGLVKRVKKLKIFCIDTFEHVLHYVRLKLVKILTKLKRLYTHVFGQMPHQRLKLMKILRKLKGLYVGAWSRVLYCVRPRLVKRVKELKGL